MSQQAPVTAESITIAHLGDTISQLSVNNAALKTSNQLMQHRINELTQQLANEQKISLELRTKLNEATVEAEAAKRDVEPDIDPAKSAKSPKQKVN